MQPHPECTRAVQDALTAVGALDGAGEPSTVRLLPDAVHTASAAAEALGVEVGQIANSLIFDADDAPLLVLTSGAHRVDTASLAASLGVTRLRRATPEFVRTHTGGQPIGACRPRPGNRPAAHPGGHGADGVPREIWAAGGVPQAVFPTTYTELLRVTAGSPAELARTPAPELVTLHVWRTSRAALPRALTRHGGCTHAGCAPSRAFGWANLLGTWTPTGFRPGDADLTRVGGADRLGLPRSGGRRPPRRGGRACLGAHRPRLRPGGPGPTDQAEASGPVSWLFGDPPGGRVTGPVLALTRARLRVRLGSHLLAGDPPGGRRPARRARAVGPVRGRGGALGLAGHGERVALLRRTWWRSRTVTRSTGRRSCEPPPRAGYAEELFARFEVRDVVGDRSVLGWVADGGPETVKGGRA